MRIKCCLLVLVAMLVTTSGCKQPGNDIEMQGSSKQDAYGMCMEMMKDPAIMREMMDNMMRECEKDSAMCSMMSEKMMSSPRMRNMMKKRMDDENKIPQE